MSHASPKTTPWLLAALVALSALTLGLAYQNRALQGRVRDLGLLANAAQSRGYFTGAVLPAFTLVTHDGLPLRGGSDATESETLVLIGSRSCAYCDDARVEWEFIAMDWAEYGLNIVGIELDTAREDLDPDAATYPLHVPGGDAQPFVANLPGVPASLFLDREGRVIRAFYGDQAGLRETIESYFSKQSVAQNTANNGPVEPSATMQ